MILSHDGLDKRWESVQWDREYGEFRNDGGEHEMLAAINPDLLVSPHTDHTLDGTHAEFTSYSAAPEREAGFAELRQLLVTHTLRTGKNQT